MQTTPELLPQWLEGLTPELVKRAEMELGETPEVKKKALAQLRHLIADEPGFIPVTDESFLLRFLRARKFDVDRAFKTLKNYYAFKLRYTGILTDLSVIDLKPILDQNTVLILPKRDRIGTGLVVIHVGAKDIEVVSANQAAAMTYLAEEIGIDAEATQVCGVRAVIDFSNMTLSKLVHYSKPSYLASVIRAVTDCVPMRIKSIHVVNAAPFAHVMLNVIKRMLTSKMRSRFHLHHGDLESLYEFIPRENLPQSLGGDLGPKDYEDNAQEMLDRNYLIEKLNKYTFRGHERPQKNSLSS